MKILGSKFKISKLFKQDDTRFLIACGLKFSGIYFLSTLFISFLLWIIISLNGVYFESKVLGTTSALRETFLDNALGVFYAELPGIFAGLVVLFFAGAYIGKVLLRPFELIGKYCTEKLEGNTSAVYNPDIFSDYKLMTRFSEFFFIYIEQSLKDGKLVPNTIPLNYTKIRTPPFERVFFFHFLFLVAVLATATGFYIAYHSFAISEEILDLSLSLIAQKDITVGYFIKNQAYIYESIVVASCLIVVVGYVALCFHLYSKVSGAIFGFFSTMRSFMKGNFSARVHLIGYAHIRPHGRAMNKFLDHIERECTIDHNIIDSKTLTNKVD